MRELSKLAVWTLNASFPTLDLAVLYNASIDDILSSCDDALGDVDADTTACNADAGATLDDVALADALDDADAIACNADALGDADVIDDVCRIDKISVDGILCGVVDIVGSGTRYLSDFLEGVSPPHLSYIF